MTRRPTRALSRPPPTFSYTRASRQGDTAEDSGGQSGQVQGESHQAESGWRCSEKQATREGESLSRAARAVRTPPRSPAYLRVHGFVLLQAHRVPEGLAAYLTRKGSRAAVRPAHVHLEPVRRGEHLRRVGPGRRPLRGAKGRGRGLGADWGRGRWVGQAGRAGASPCCI